MIKPSITFGTPEFSEQKEHDTSIFGPLFEPIYEEQIRKQLKDYVSLEKSINTEREAKEQDIFGDLFPF